MVKVKTFNRAALHEMRKERIFKYIQYHTLRSRAKVCLKTAKYIGRVTSIPESTVRRIIKELADEKRIVITHVKSGARIITIYAAL